MERDLTILLVEDEPFDCQNFIAYVDSVPDTSLIGITKNVSDALAYTEDLMPDAVILDLELHKGSGNGLEFLKKVKQLPIQVLPYIVVTTNNSSQITYDYARQLGADFIMSKYQSDYSAQNVIEFLRSLKNTLHNRARMCGFPSELSTPESIQQINKRILHKIRLELNLVGLSPKAIGTEYLTEAIQITINKPQKCISAIIADRHGKSTASVDRAMQSAINNAWKSSDIDDLRTYYTARIRPDKGAPTVLELISYYSDKIKRGY